MIQKEDIQMIVQEFVQGTDMFLVEIRVSHVNAIKVYIDSFSGVDIDTCVELSRFIEDRLNREEEDFELQVSSAGLSESFRVHEQYEKNVGKTVSVLTSDGKKLTGEMQQVAEDSITLVYTEKVKTGPKGKKKEQEQTAVIPFADIKETTLVITIK
ncbi:MAG: ribosome assembly cofactor RimP [Bacteroidales bacterium]|jgi:ribosome maturation factor RimP|nr:ribosome assembly cofactor RimP [Bacteroidales bacterium]